MIILAIQKKGKLNDSYKDLREIVDHQPLVKSSSVFEYIAVQLYSPTTNDLQTGNDPQTGTLMIANLNPTWSGVEWTGVDL